MRQLTITELNNSEITTITTFLDKNTEAGAIPGIYWLNIPEELFGEAQIDHQQCGPFIFGLELGTDSLFFEMLVRSKQNLHCSCTAYATTKQRLFLLDFYDRLIAETGIKS